MTSTDFSRFDSGVPMVGRSEVAERLDISSDNMRGLNPSIPHIKLVSGMYLYPEPYIDGAAGGQIWQQREGRHAAAMAEFCASDVGRAMAVACVRGFETSVDTVVEQERLVLSNIDIARALKVSITTIHTWRGLGYVNRAGLLPVETNGNLTQDLAHEIPAHMLFGLYRWAIPGPQADDVYGRTQLIPPPPTGQGLLTRDEAAAELGIGAKAFSSGMRQLHRAELPSDRQRYALPYIMAFRGRGDRSVRRPSIISRLEAFAQTARAARAIAESERWLVAAAQAEIKTPAEYGVDRYTALGGLAAILNVSPSTMYSWRGDVTPEDLEAATVEPGTSRFNLVARGVMQAVRWRYPAAYPHRSEQ